jgi:hypothetical protein
VARRWWRELAVGRKTDLYGKWSGAKRICLESSRAQNGMGWPGWVECARPRRASEWGSIAAGAVESVNPIGDVIGIGRRCGRTAETRLRVRGLRAGERPGVRESRGYPDDGPLA